MNETPFRPGGLVCQPSDNEALFRPLPDEPVLRPGEVTQWLASRGWTGERGAAPTSREDDNADGCS